MTGIYSSKDKEWINEFKVITSSTCQCVILPEYSEPPQTAWTLPPIMVQFYSIQFNSLQFNDYSPPCTQNEFPQMKEGDARCLMQHILHIYSTTKETVHRWPMNWTRPPLSHIWPTSNQQMCALHDVLCNAHLTHHRVCDHTPAAAPRNYTRHKQPFSMVPLKSPIATVTVNSIRGVGLVVPHKTIQRRTYTEL